MEQNKIRTYLLYALGEIFLVVIGILIALQVNNWNEMRKAQIISDDTMISLRLELEEAKEFLELANQANERILKESELYLTGKFNLDSLGLSAGRVFWLTNNAPVTLELPIVKRELSSDNLIKGNDEIKLKLRDIIQSYQSSESIRTLSSKFWNEQVSPYYIKTGTMMDANRYFLGKDFDESSAKALLSEKEFKNLVAMSNLGQFQLVQFYNQLIRLMDETIEIIEGMN